jgi:hypothetical protein
MAPPAGPDRLAGREIHVDQGVLLPCQTRIGGDPAQVDRAVLEPVLPGEPARHHSRVQQPRRGREQRDLRAPAQPGDEERAGDQVRMAATGEQDAGHGPR